MSKLISLSDSVLTERQEIVERYEGLATTLDPRWSPRGNVVKDLIPVVGAALLDESQFVPDHVLSHADYLGGSDIGRTDVMSALQRSNIDTSKLSNFDMAQLQGAMISARGALVENDVYEKLLSHRLPMPEGATDVVQETFNNPGSDFTFVDSHGAVIEHMNVKAEIDYVGIRNHFHAHPDVRVVFATHDAALSAKQHGYEVISGHAHHFAMHGNQVVVDIGHTSTWYQDLFLRHSPGFGSFDHAHVLNDGFSHGSFVQHFPWISAGAILYRAARRYHTGMELAEQKKLAKQDIARAGIIVSFGKALHAMGFHFPGTTAGTVTAGLVIGGLHNVRESWSDLSASESSLAEYAESIV